MGAGAKSEAGIEQEMDELVFSSTDPEPEVAEEVVAEAVGA